MRDLRALRDLRGLRSHFAGGGGDADVALYIATAGITDVDEIAAITTAVAALKAGDLWDLSYLIYPLSPTSLAAAAVPLKAVAFTMSWLNTPSHAQAGITFNGTTSHGDTGWTANDEVDSNIDFGYTIRTSFSGSNPWAHGAAATDLTGARGFGGSVLFYNGNNNPVVGTISAAGTKIHTSSRRSATDHEGYINGVPDGVIVVSSTGLPALPEYLGGRNLASALANANAGTSSWLHYHKGLSDAEALEINNIIAAYSTSVR